MTLSFSWATNALYSTGPDAGSSTKVDPASTANGFINGTIAAAQHVNFLFNGLATELVKAVDGVNGGTYTLGSVLRFEGADVQIAADLEVVSGGGLNVNAGGQINVDSGAQIDIAGEINVLNGGDIDIESGAQIDLESGGVLNVLSGGDINVASGGDINLASGGELAIASGGFVSVAAGGSINVDGTLNIVTGGGNMAVSGAVAVSSGGTVTLGAGALLTIEDQNDLLINSDSVSARMSMTPTWIESAGGAVTWDRSAVSPGAALIQTQVDATNQYIAMFPIVLPPGDDITGVLAVIHGTIGSAGDHGAVPGLTPRLIVISVDSAGVQTTISAGASPNDGTDQSASQAEYDSNHTLAWLPASTLTINGSTAYYVLILGEAGSDSQANSLGIRSIIVNATARSFRGTSSGNLIP